MAAICSTVPIVRIVQGPSSASSVFRSRSESLTPPFGSQKSSEPSIASGSSFVAIASATFRTARPGASGSIATCSFPAEAFELGGGERLSGGDLRDLGAGAQEDRHVVAELAGQPGFDLGREVFPLDAPRRLEDHVAAGAKGGDVGQVAGFAGRAQVVVRDPASAEVHPAQEGDVAGHAH